MWDLPGSGIEPEFPAQAGEFFTTEPPGKQGSPALFASESPGGLVKTQLGRSAVSDSEVF